MGTSDWFSKTFGYSHLAACHLFASIVFVKRVLHVKIFLAGGRCPPDPPVFGWGGKAPPDLQWKTHPVHKYWVQPDASCHQWGFCDDMFQPRQPGHVFNTFNFQGFSHSLFPNIHLKSFPSASMFISKCCKCILTNKLLTQRGLPFSSPWEAWKHEKWWKIEWKTMNIQGFFKCFNFVAFWGCFKATWGSLEAFLGCPEASWRRLGGS